MATLKQKKDFIKSFERSTNLGKTKAYSNLSVKRPLTNTESEKYKNIMGDLYLR